MLRATYDMPSCATQPPRPPRTRWVVAALVALTVLSFGTVFGWGLLIVHERGVMAHELEMDEQFCLALAGKTAADIGAESSAFRDAKCARLEFSRHGHISQDEAVRIRAVSRISEWLLAGVNMLAVSWLKLVIVLVVVAGVAHIVTIKHAKTDYLFRGLPVDVALRKPRPCGGGDLLHQLRKGAAQFVADPGHTEVRLTEQC